MRDSISTNKGGSHGPENPMQATSKEESAGPVQTGASTRPKNISIMNKMQNELLTAGPDGNTSLSVMSEKNISTKEKREMMQLAKSKKTAFAKAVLASGHSGSVKNPIYRSQSTSQGVAQDSKETLASDPITD